MHPDRACSSVTPSDDVPSLNTGAGASREMTETKVLFRNCEGGKDCPTFYAAPDGRILVQGDIVSLEERQALGLGNLPAHETLVAIPHDFIEKFIAAAQR